MENKTQKTIFIFISQSVIIKNILRSGGFALLKNTDYRLVVFIKCKEMPEYIKKEFEAENATLIQVFEKDRAETRLENLKGKFASYLLWNDTSKRYFRHSVNFRNRSR